LKLRYDISLSRFASNFNLRRYIKVICEDIVAGMAEEVGLYRSGKTRLMGKFVGEVMKRTGGRANPKEAAAIMKSLLDP
jgi:Asp-tRNA(Asn)/Glu-tRNA(Gln) amidotransferase B subunit